ncbi:MAG: hypothetical protein J0M08_02735 [Bacteroidetes bacterium]|nr:hypothetical protein [Bacteroidota bacterium]
MRVKHLLLSAIILLANSSFFSQNTTINPSKTQDDMMSIEAILRKEKLLIIPFDPKMYLSDVDKKIGTTNNMNFYQVRNAMRAGVDEEIYFALKKKFNVYSLLMDSLKNKKDVAYVHENIGYSYDLAPADNTTKKNTKPQKSDNKPKIVNGQLQVEVNQQKKFMNAEIQNKEILTYLANKYNATVFVFINELDIRSNPESFDINTDSYSRDVTVHFSVFDTKGNYLNFGTANTSFSSNLNDPEKIAKNHFSEIGRQLSNSIETSLIPDELKKKQQEKSKSQKVR